MSELIRGDAGRIGFLLRGDYSADATYGFLDVVYSGGASYVAKKETKGNPPSENSEYWQILARGCAEGDFASKAIYGDDAVSLGRKEGSVAGNRSIAYGENVVATQRGAVSFGGYNESSGDCSFSAGWKNNSSAKNTVSMGLNNNSFGANSASFGNNNVSLDSHSCSVGCGNIALGYGSHAENCQNIAGAKYVFKIESYDTAGKKFTFDDIYTGFADAFAALEVGSKLFVQNFYYINDALVFTVNSIESDGKSIIVEESIPSSNFNVYFATIIQASSGYSGCHVEGRKNLVAGMYAHAEGYGTEAIDSYAHTEGIETQAGFEAHAEGLKTIASGYRSHAEGYNSIASGNNSHAEGWSSKAEGESSHAGGYLTVASGAQSYAAGWLSEAKCNRSFALGQQTIAGSDCQLAIGRCNTDDNTPGYLHNIFIVGNGTAANNRTNVFRIFYDGAVYAKGQYNSSGADYAEFIRPWADGNPDNEDRVGYFVTIKDGYLHKAEADDYIVGITSGNPSVVGNSDEEYYWRWERDEFNRIVYEEVEEYVEKFDKEGNPVLKDGKPIMIPTGRMEKRMKQAAGYDGSLQQSYVERKDRPEWDYVGMVGVVPVRDDGTCVAGSYCRCGTGGAATLADMRGFDTYMVLERIADNIDSVILK